MSVEFTVPADVNRNQSIEIALVIVYDELLVEVLESTSASEWFGMEQEMMGRNFPSGLQPFSWELVPGQLIEPVSVDVRPGAKAGFVFANYAAPGEHRARLDLRAEIRVTLGRDSFTVDPY